MKEFFEGKINELENLIAEGSTSIQDLENNYTGLLNSIGFMKASNLVTEEEQQELVSKLELCNEKINGMTSEKTAAATVVAPASNVVAVNPGKKRMTTGEKLATAGAVLAAGTVGLGIASASGCFAEKTEENTNENENESINSLETVSKTLSTFVNDGLENGVDISTDQSLALMSATNLESKIDLGDDINLDQVVIYHYIQSAEELIAKNAEYKGRTVSDVAAELMTADYQGALVNINEAFINYAHVMPTNTIVVNEVDKAALLELENAMEKGAKNNGEFADANSQIKEMYKENTPIYRGTQVIADSQYSAIYEYEKNSRVELKGMDEEVLKVIFRTCGKDVKKGEFNAEAFTNYMTEITATLRVDIDRKINEVNSKAASLENFEELAQQKYDAIDKFIKENRVELVTPENVNKVIFEEIEKENKDSKESLEERYEQGYKEMTDSNGDKFLGKEVSQAEKEAVKKADKEKAEKEAEIKYDEGFKEDNKGNVIDSEGNNLGKPSVGEKPVPDAPVMTPDEVKDTEDKAEDLLEKNDGIISEEFIPLDQPIVVEETVTTSIDGKVVSQNTYTSNQQTIAELEDLKNQLNNAASNTTETVVTEENSFNPFEEVVTFTPVEGIDENGNLLPGYTFDENYNIVKESVKNR